MCCLLQLTHVVSYTLDVSLVHQRHLDLKQAKLLLKFFKLLILLINLFFQLVVFLAQVVGLKRVGLFLEFLLELLLKVVKISIDHRNHANFRLHSFNCFVEILDHLAEFIVIHFFPNCSM